MLVKPGPRVLGESLVDRHVLSRDDLEHRDRASRDRTGKPLPAVLLRIGLVGEKDLTRRARRDQSGVPFVDFLETPIHQDAPTLDHRRSGARTGIAAAASTSRARKLVVAFAEPATTTRCQADRRRDRLRDHPGGRRPRRAPERDRHDLRPGPQRRAEPRRARERRRSASEPDELHINDLLDMLVSSWSGSDLHLTVGLAAGHPRARRAAPGRRARPDQRLARSARWSTRSSRRSSGRSSRTSSSSTLVHAAGQEPLPRERVPAARLGRLR